MISYLLCCFLCVNKSQENGDFSDWTELKYVVWSKDEDMHWDQKWVLKLSAISYQVEEDDGKLNVTPTATTSDLLENNCLNHNLFAINSSKTP